MAAGAILATVALGAVGVAASSGAHDEPADASHDHESSGGHDEPAEAPHDHDVTDEPAMDHEASADSDAAHDHAHARDYQQLLVDATPEERAAAAALVDATREATAKYAEYEAALDAGYRPNPMGGPNSTHHPNPALMRDGRVLDPEAPESLMYWTAPDRSKVLVGAVFKTRANELAPAPGGALTAWHTHVADTKCYPAEDATCPQDAGKMLHVFFFDGVQDPFTENMVAAAGGRRAFLRAMAAQL